MKKKDEKLVMDVDVKTLKPHPKSQEIYGHDEEVADIIELYEARQKIVESLIVNTETNQIISGNRRWKAAQKLGLETVPVEFRHYDNEEDELADIIICNKERDRTLEQKTREGMALEETYILKAYEKRVKNLLQNRVDMDTVSNSESDDKKIQQMIEEKEPNLTRDKVAKAVKISSGKTYERAKVVVATADQLKESGNENDNKLLLQVLNKESAATAFKLKDILDKLTDEEKEKIKSEGVKKSNVDIVNSNNSPKISTKKPVNYTMAMKKSVELKSVINSYGKTVPIFTTEKQKELYITQLNEHIKKLQEALQKTGGIEITSKKTTSESKK